MKIILVTPEYPPKNIGGGGIVYKNLAKELVKVGHNVVVLSGDFHNRNLIGEIKGVNDEGVQINFIPLIPPPSIGYINLTTYTPPTFLGIIFLMKKLFQEKPDIIHLHGLGHPLIDITSLICILLRREYIFTCHGIPKSQKIAGSIFRLIFRIYLATLAKLTISKAIAMTTVSQSQLMECRRMGLTNNMMITIPNGLNPDLKEVKPDIVKKIEEKYSLIDKKLIFSIGRLSRVKGFQYLIEAMPYIISKIPRAFAIIAGSGPYKEYLEKIIEEKRLSECIKLVGWVSEEEKSVLYQCADIVVFPSTYEPFGIVLLEAMIMHKAIIAFKKPPMSEIIKNEVEGLLVSLGDKKELAKSIVRVLSDDKLRESLISNTYVKIQSFRWEKIVRKYIDLYLEVCGQKPNRHKFVLTKC